VTVRRADLVVVDSIEQSKIESGDLLGPIERGQLSWDRVHELADVVVGRVGRRRREEITLFESHGLAIEDIAVAARAYELARERGIGQEIPL
jgi:ornithine cyclodeaminase/alanine dehydrogenase-like protein (mu-crystallin family)